MTDDPIRDEAVSLIRRDGSTIPLTGDALLVAQEHIARLQEQITERIRDHEKMIIACDNALQVLEGRRKSSPVSERICRNEIDRQRAKYGCVAKTWSKDAA